MRCSPRNSAVISASSASISASSLRLASPLAPCISEANAARTLCKRGRIAPASASAPSLPPAQPFPSTLLPKSLRSCSKPSYLPLRARSWLDTNPCILSERIPRRSCKASRRLSMDTLVLLRSMSRLDPIACRFSRIFLRWASEKTRESATVTRSLCTSSRVSFRSSASFISLSAIEAAVISLSSRPCSTAASSASSRLWFACSSGVRSGFSSSSCE
mmetsp:Transcript_7493/g.23223  ORF Transcript_7493/g.23223 Transcript_7493/m.23223 type:complete len:217 (+) Transcript_7493:1307-1957(+)